MANKILTRLEAFNIGGGGSLAEPNRCCTIAKAFEYGCDAIATSDKNEKRLIWNALKAELKPSDPEFTTSSWGFSYQTNGLYEHIGNANFQDTESTKYGYRPLNYTNHGSFINDSNRYLTNYYDYYNCTMSGSRLMLLWPDTIYDYSFESDESARIEASLYSTDEMDFYTPKSSIIFEIGVSFGQNALNFPDTSQQGMCYLDLSGFIPDYKIKFEYHNQVGGYITSVRDNRGYSFYIDNHSIFTLQIQLGCYNGKWQVRIGNTTYETNMDSSYRVNEILPPSYSLIAMTPIEVQNFSGKVTICR